VAAIAVEWVVVQRFFAPDLTGRGVPEPRPDARLPAYPVAVIGLTLAGFFATSIVHVDPAFAAAAGAVALAVPALRSGRASIGDVGRALDLPFLVFVLALGLVVRAVSDRGLGAVVEHLLPNGTSFWALLGLAAIAAALSNMINNLPAVLLMLPVVAAGGADPVLAVLIGCNAGPNLTYVGSLATMLWRRALRRDGAEPSTWEYTRLGVLTVPPVVLAATVALWVSLRLAG